MDISPVGVLVFERQSNTSVFFSSPVIKPIDYIGYGWPSARDERRGLTTSSQAQIHRLVLR